MQIVIRADASVYIGSGHIMRCLSLANELKTAGAEVCFISRNSEGEMSRQITEYGHMTIK